MATRKTLAEQARELGISISTLKARKRRAKEADAIDKARRALAPSSAGWNPRAGAKKGHRP